MVFFIKFHFNKFFIYFIICSITDIGRYCIRLYFLPKIFNNFIIKLFLMFLGETLSGIIYLYQKKTILKSIHNNFNYNPKNDPDYDIFFIQKYIFFCAFLDFISSFDISQYFPYSISKLSMAFDYLDKISLCLFLPLNEIFTLNIETYSHHYIGLFLMLISLLYLIAVESIKNIKSNLSFSFLFCFIVSLESQYILSMIYSIEKKLFYEYFENIFHLCCFEGIYGNIILVLYVVFIYRDYSSLFDNLNKETNNFILILFSIFYCILTCIYNIYIYKITSEGRPSFNIVGDIFYVFILNILNLIFEKEVFDFHFVISNIFSLLGGFIFTEFMTLNFWNLDEFTKNKIIERSQIDISMVNLDNINSEEFPNIIII